MQLTGQTAGGQAKDQPTGQKQPSYDQTAAMLHGKPKAKLLFCKSSDRPSFRLSNAINQASEQATQYATGQTTENATE